LVDSVKKALYPALIWKENRSYTLVDVGIDGPNFDGLFARCGVRVYVAFVVVFAQCGL
jgi:hypothetical protein